MDPWVSAAVVARASHRPRVAICVTNLVSRHPAVTAAAIASLDQVSNGRAVLGIGAGHSGTRNIGLPRSGAKELAEGVNFIKAALTGQPAQLGEAVAHLPWIKRPPPVFLAASHPRPLQAAGRTADGAFVNYGLGVADIAASHAHLAQGSAAAGRSADELEIWQIAALDCTEDRDVARRKVGAILAFVAGYVIGDKNLETRGVPEHLREPLLELRRRYSTRPGEADVRLVEELGLFDYLARRLAICGNPDDCLAQALAAKGPAPNG
jgi:5,10-methylenetetrahydromethanopterin reductase